MGDVDREADRLPPLAITVPMGDDVADEVVAVHAAGELRFHIVADAGLDAAQIGIGRRIDPRPDKEPLLDQLGDLRGLDDDVEDLPSPRPSPRHGVAVIPSSTAFGYSAMIFR